MVWDHEVAGSNPATPTDQAVLSVESLSELQTIIGLAVSRI
jgi:hypothetical protein